MRRAVSNDAVVVPLPGMLLTRELFEGARLDDAFAGHARSVDAELGETTIQSASSIGEAADSLIAGLERRHAGAPAVLVGHSFGGYVALEVARRAPSHLAGLVLLSTQCRGNTQGAAARREKQVGHARSAGIPKVIDSLLPALLSPKAREDEAVVDAILRMAESTGVDKFARQMQASINRADYRCTVQGLDPSVPVLVVSGGRDRLTPPQCTWELAKMLKAREEAALAQTQQPAPWGVRSHAESGHLLCLEQPDALHDYLATWADEVGAF